MLPGSNCQRGRGKEREEGFALAQILHPSLEDEEEEEGKGWRDGEGGQRSTENRSGGRASQPLPDARVLLSWELDNGL